MTETPQTPMEWAEYITGLDDTQLWSQSVAVNSQEFVRELMNEGSSVLDVKIIAELFAKQLLSRELKLPEGGAFDMHLLSIL